jgi:glycosyltransferase involved in cell wall biosynthesis
MDATILTSISEGQPLTILEGYAAHKPAIATDVGNCRGLIYGENDDFGTAGILTHVMNVDEIASAMVFIAKNREKARAMGEIGYKRMMNRFKLSDLKNAYTKIYKQFGEELGLEWQE